jgi:hypothetical protein
MVFILPVEFHTQDREELPVAQLDLGPQPGIFEKPRAKNYRHLKALYLKGYINGQPVNKMLVDTGAAVNIMPYSVLLWQNQPELYRLKYVSPLLRAPTCFKRYNPLACRVTSR